MFEGCRERPPLFSLHQPRGRSTCLCLYCRKAPEVYKQSTLHLCPSRLSLSLPFFLSVPSLCAINAANVFRFQTLVENQGCSFFFFKAHPKTETRKQTCGWSFFLLNAQRHLDNHGLYRPQKLPAFPSIKKCISMNYFYLQSLHKTPKTRI